jgi:gliding motility-associated-like protein
MTINNAPIKGAYSFWASVFNKTILYWSPFKDDFTVAKSLTYDLRVTRHNEILVTGLFDINNESRLTPSNGYQLTNTFIILPGKGCPTYFIQSVDNAFNGSKLLQLQCSNGNSCPSDITTAQVQACKDTNTIIGTDEEAHWFSFNNGFKGISKKLIFKADQPDTIVSVIVGNQCPKVKAYIIQVNEGSKNEMETKYVCAGRPTKIGIPTGWSNVVWDYEGKSLTSDTIVVSLLKPLVVSVAATSGNCQYKKQFNLNISDFDLKLDNDSYIINQGQSAQLGASGGSKYEWLPNVALSNNKVANPVASPIQTIQYEVTALDSINCSKKASVKVEVINTGFLPNLFTPNGDGKNDDYKILGLYGATDFEFVIYNREGTIVYETTSWQTATSLGWNGQKGGVNQPSGLYYWKVQGKQPNGQTLLLNGKSTGSVLLIR